MAKRYDLIMRILLIGDSGVGKTCMLCKYTEDKQIDGHSTIGIDFKWKRINLDGKRIKLQIWDTAGQERFETITKQYYRRAQGIMLVYDITNEESFEHIDKWMDNVQSCADENVCVMLIGNKLDIDKQRKVSKKHAEKISEKYGIPLFETSAVEDDNIEKAFLDLSQMIMKQYQQEFDAYRLERCDSDGGEFISELLREDSMEKSSCCT